MEKHKRWPVLNKFQHTRNQQTQLYRNSWFYRHRFQFRQTQGFVLTINKYTATKNYTAFKTYVWFRSGVIAYALRYSYWESHKLDTASHMRDLVEQVSAWMWKSFAQPQNYRGSWTVVLLANVASCTGGWGPTCIASSFDFIGYVVTRFLACCFWKRTPIRQTKWWCATSANTSRAWRLVRTGSALFAINTALSLGLSVSPY